MSFAYPYLLLLIPAILLFELVRWRGNKNDKGAAFSAVALLPAAGSNFQAYLITWLRLLTLVFLIVASARPQQVEKRLKTSGEGLDIALTIDTSKSMSEAIPYASRTVTRLQAVKLVAKEFISARPGDRIGLVVFGEEAFTQAPLTLDHQVLGQFLDKIYINMAGSGTAIGPAIATATKRLKDIPSKSKIMILLTDGVDSGTGLSPLAAADAAETLGIKIYTIGIGSSPGLLGGFFGGVRQSLDEDSLRKIAEKTGGKYFRADDVTSLSEVYKTINQLEKSTVEIQDFSLAHELAGLWLMLALVSLATEFLIRSSGLRVVQ